MLKNYFIIAVSGLIYFTITSAAPKFDFKPVSFKSSMSYSYAFHEKICNCNEWKILQNLYDKHVIHDCEISNEPRIPKIIHWIWLGSPLPEKYKKLQQTWKDANPGWDFILWTDAHVKSFKLKNQDAFNKAINWGEKSDIFRYEILYRYGGVYVDIDFECLRSFDVLNHICDFYTGIAYTSKPILYNGLIGAAKNHPILAACIEHVQASGTNNSEEIMAKSGPYFFTNTFFKSLKDCVNSRIVAFPVTYLYPIPNNQRNKFNWHVNDIRRFLHPESFAVHYWGTSWVKK